MRAPAQAGIQLGDWPASAALLDAALRGRGRTHRREGSRWARYPQVCLPASPAGQMRQLQVVSSLLTKWLLQQSCWLQRQPFILATS